MANFYFFHPNVLLLYSLGVYNKQKNIRVQEMYKQTTTKGQQQNIIKIDKCITKDKTAYTIEYEMSDLACQQFQGFNEKILSVPVDQMLLLQKQLDKKLSWLSKVGASVLGVKTKHEFLIFQTKRFLMTIDFYEGNKIHVRIGDKCNVLETTKSTQRKNAEIVRSNDGLQWRRQFKQGQLLVKDIINCLKYKQLVKAQNKISFNGSHFSRILWADLVQTIDKRKSNN